MARRRPIFPASELQAAYEARRFAWRLQVNHWLATRELPGAPPSVQGAEDALGGLAAAA